MRVEPMLLRLLAYSGKPLGFYVHHYYASRLADARNVYYASCSAFVRNVYYASCSAFVRDVYYASRSVRMFCSHVVISSDLLSSRLPWSSPAL